MGPSFPCSGVSGCYCRLRRCFSAGPSAAGPALAAWSRNFLASCRIFRTRANSLWEKVAPYGKYLAIAVCLSLYFYLGQPRTDIPIRVGEFFPSVGLTFEHADLSWRARTAFVLSFLVLGMVLTNAWCRYACPTGGLLEALKSMSLFKVYKTHRCNLCGQCREICYMETLPAETNCTNCGDCLNSCPRDAIKLGRRKQSSLTPFRQICSRGTPALTPMPATASVACICLWPPGVISNAATATGGMTVRTRVDLA